MSKPGSETDRASKRKHQRTRAIAGKDFAPKVPDQSWREPFVESLRAMPNVKQACEAAGIGRKTVYDYRDEDPAFAAAWDSAIEDGKDEIRKRIQARLDGSDRILELAARLWLPEYKDKLEVSGSLAVPLMFTFKLDKANAGDADGEAE